MGLLEPDAGRDHRLDLGQVKASFRSFGVLLVALSTGCAAPATQRTELGGGNYVITKRSGFVSVASGVLKTQLQQQALADCASQGKALAVGDVSGVDPDPPGLPSATMQYRCVPI